MSGFIVAPTEFIVGKPCSKSDNSLAGILDESGQYGCSTERVSKPTVEVKFDKVYQFTTLEILTNKKYPDDQGRIKGVDISIRSNETDSWKEIRSFRDGNAQTVDLNVAARYFKFDRFGTGEVSFGKMWFRASDAPAVNIKTKTGEIIQVSNAQDSGNVENLDEPPYTEGEISVVAPIKLVLSSKDTWGNNTIEGLLDETGKYGACTQNGSKQNVVLTFSRVFLFTHLEFKACRLGENNQFGLLEDTLIEYKQLESQDWVSLKEIKKSDIKKHPESTFLHFDTPVKARAFRLTKQGNGFVQLFLGMLKLFAYHPYTEIKTVSGVVSKYSPESSTPQSSSPPPIPTTTSSQPVISQPVATPQPVVQSTPPTQVTQPVVAQPTPVVTQPVVQPTPVTTTSQPTIVTPPISDSDEPKFTSGEINCIPPLEMKQSSKDSWGDNSLQGLFEESGKLGVCTAKGMNNYIEIKYGSVYLFTYLEFKGSKLGESMQLDTLQNVRIEYKVKESDAWTVYSTIKRTDIKLNPQVNTITFETPIKARSWRFFKEGNDHLFIGMVRLFGYTEYVPIQTKNGVIKSLKETLAQWEPKYTSGEINVIPIKELKSKGESRRENTLEGLLDDSGDYGYTTAGQNYIELEFESVYLFTQFEYMSLGLSNDPLAYLKGMKIEYKVQDSDPWSLATTLGDSIQVSPKVNTITLSEPIKAKKLKLQGAGSILEIGMFRPIGYSPFVPVQTKSGPLLTKEQALQMMQDPNPGCQEFNLVKPIGVYRNTTNSRQKGEAKVLDDLMKPDGSVGFSTYGSSNSYLEYAFDRVYNFRVMTFRNHLKKDQYDVQDGTGRSISSSLVDTVVQYKLNTRDEWQKFGTVYATKTNVKDVFMLDFGELGLKAKAIRFLQKSPQGLSGVIAVGMTRFYAFTPDLKVKIGNDVHSEIKVKSTRKEDAKIPKLTPPNLVDPIYTESTCPDINVVAPINIYSSRTETKKADNTIEGLLDESGQFGTIVSESVHNYLILEFEAVFNFKYFEFQTNPKFNFTSHILYSKVNESDQWTRVKNIPGTVYTTPRLNVIKFDGEGINARFFKFEKVCGDISYGMLHFFAVAPFVPYKTKKGAIRSTEQQEAEFLTKYKGDQVNCLIPDDVYMEYDLDEVRGNKEESEFDCKDKADNTMEGLFDDSAEYGMCSTYGTLIVGYENIHFFKHFEYFTHSLFDEKNQIKFSSDIQVYYKIRIAEPWIPIDTIETSKPYPSLNKFELSTSPKGLKARYFKLEAPEVLLLGTFKVFGFGELVTPPVINVAGKGLVNPAKLKDLSTLEKNYAKLISETFKPVSEGLGPVKQIQNDMSKAVKPVIKGDSKIELIIPESASSTDLPVRKSFTPVEIMAGKLCLQMLNVRFVNSSNSPMSVTSLKMEYLNHDNTWTLFSDQGDALYWQPEMIKTVVKNFQTDKYETIYKESETQGKYVHIQTFNVGAGETVQYNIECLHKLTGDCAEYNTYGAATIPYDFPYPCTFRFTFVDSQGKSRSVEHVYMCPPLLGIQVPEEFKQRFQIKEYDFCDEVSDNVNRSNSFVGVKLDPKGDGILLYNSGLENYKQECTKKFNLANLRFEYENKKLNEHLLWDSKGQFCKAKFFLLCDPELYYRGYCIKVVASSVSSANKYERYYPLYGFLQKVNPLALNKK